MDTTNHTRGFDSRFWTGEAPAADYKWVGIKVTDGQNNMSSLCVTQHAAAARQGKLRLPFHFWRYASNPAIQAQRFYENVSILGFELPPCIDLEDNAAPKSSATAAAIHVFGRETARLFAPQPIIVYTAPWFWDTWVKAWQSQFTDWNPYACGLWNADPAPTGPLPGKWSDYVIRQLLLDINEPWCKSAVDVDWARDAWYNAAAGLPMPVPLTEKVDRLWNAHPDLH